jgi:hypothetical protein
MTLKGYLSALLPQRLLDRHYTLTEDDEFVYVWHSNLRVFTFSAHGATMEAITQEIDLREKSLEQHKATFTAELSIVEKVQRLHPKLDFGCEDPAPSPHEMGDFRIVTDTAVGELAAYTDVATLQQTLPTGEVVLLAGITQYGLGGEHLKPESIYLLELVAEGIAPDDEATPDK